MHPRKVRNASLKRRYHLGVGRRLVLFSIHVEQNVGLASMAGKSMRPRRTASGRVPSSGVICTASGERSERRTGFRRSGPHGLAIGQPIFAHQRFPPLWTVECLYAHIGPEKG